MRLRLDQLERHLEGELAPLYIVSGEEPLQREETLDALRRAARARGFDEREVLHVDARFDWSALAHFGDSMSLFSAQRILELRVGSKLDDAGRKALTAFAARLPPDVVTLLLLAFRVDGTMARSKWFSALEKAGAHLQAWPVAADAMPGWVTQRARRRGLDLDPDAVALLAERGEGNLLAAAQDIDRLRLLHPSERVGALQVLSATSDSARFGAFDLVDACFAGDVARILRILRGLREEGARIPEILGPVAWAMRSAAEVSERMAAGEPFERALTPRHGAWRAPQRMRILESAVRRHPPARWARLLARASLVDRRSKGDMGRLHRGIRRAQLDAWSELENLALALGGLGGRRAARDDASR